jgi:hypothetical protein
MILAMTQVTIKHEYSFKKTTSNKLSETYKILLPPQKPVPRGASKTKDKRRQLACKK